MDDRSTRIGDEKSAAGYGTEDVRGYAADVVPRSADAEARVVPVEGDSENPDRRTREIREEIEQTREEMSETIDAIQEKLAPRNLVASATESVRSKASETVNAATERVKQMTGYSSEWNSYERSDTGVMARIRNNPLPAAMAAVGLTWLMVNGRSRNRRYRDLYGPGSERYRTRGAGRYGRSGYDLESYGGETERSYGTESYRADYGAAEASYGSMSEERSEGRGTVQSLTSGVRDMTSQTAESARQTTRRVQNKFQRALSENPLLVGAAVAVIGAAVGAALPETDRENRLVGDARDSVVERAQDMARGVAERVEEAATRVADAAGEAASTITSPSSTPPSSPRQA
jgi:hypothetical protein